jgi:hypothetical protein
MKTQLTILALISAITFSNVISAEEIELPKITKPLVLEEGTQRELTTAQIAELLPWAKNSRLFLKDLLESTQGIATSDRIERLTSGIKEVVLESNQKNSELFMRYILNRGIVLNEIIEKESDPTLAGSSDAQIRVLLMSINMALKYFDVDMQILSKKSAAPFKTFGVEYFEFLNDLNKSIFDASTQYNIQRTALEWLQWDLYRDLNNARFAPQIFKINNNLKIFPVKKMTDGQAIAFIRQMKKVTTGMDFGDGQVIKGSTGKTAAIESETINSSDDSNIIKIGSRVLYNLRYPGTVREIFSGGKVSILLDGNPSTTMVNIAQLAKGVKCFNGYCEKNRMVYKKAYVGKVIEVYSNSWIKVLLDGNSFYTVAPMLDSSKGLEESQCLKGACVGKRMVYQGSYPGVIKEVFEDGSLKVLLDGNSSHGVVDLSKVNIAQ